MEIPENVNPKEFLELAKVFLRPDQVEVKFSLEDPDWSSKKKEFLKQRIFSDLSLATQYKPKWGILSGVRPVKLTGSLVKEMGIINARQRLINFYNVDPEKVDLLLDIHKYQKENLVDNTQDIAIYIGIPFCPTRCSYCSFTSNQATDQEMKLYIDALIKEITSIGSFMKTKNRFPETIYIGGGTPTSLPLIELKRLMETVDQAFSKEKLKEFTVEAGRPDTISQNKLELLKCYAIDRISINPQSMNDKTLERIGRGHSSEAVIKAFELAKEYDFKINSDVIAGLPGESLEDFEKTLLAMIEQGPDNITVHTLAVKKSSRLIAEDKDYHYSIKSLVEAMLEKARSLLTNAGYSPYYLYRLKHMAGSLENVGYCRNDSLCHYNVRIMEEHQTVLALGAGGISKNYFPKKDRLERIPNVSNYKVYIERVDEMIKRKTGKLFVEEEL